MHQEDEMSYNGAPSPPCFFPQGFLLPPLDIGGAMQGRRPPWGEDAGDEDLSDDCSLPGEKKRRLSVEQVRTLERSFEAANKLEPERKTNLARALGLQPRQVAIWFQNRRARWKTKQLEKDFDSLKRDFDLLKSHNDSLLAHNKTLHSQLMALRGREGAELINLNKETEGSSSNRSDNSCDVNLDEPLDPNQYSKDFFPPFRNPPKMMMDTDDENFGNVFYGGGGGVDEPSAFWPWAEH